MKRKIIVLLTIAVLGISSFLFALEDHLTDATIVKDCDPDARVNLNPAPQQKNIDDGRALGDILMTIDLAAIGVPVTGYAGSGLTWDGTYLYYNCQNNHTMYLIDPTGPTLITSWSLTPGSWGLGFEENLWVADTITDSCYGAGGAFYCLQGGADWMADITEWWTDGELWLLSVGGTNKMYKFSIPDGTLLDSLGDATWTSISQRGLTYDPHNHKFWLGGWNSNMVWEVDPTTGAPTRQFSFNNVAGIAYDWQSSLHPDPVLWIATNEATDYIHMVDIDNPPVGIEKPEKIHLTVSLSQNVPNPVNSGITIFYYTIPAHDFVSLTIYNTAGRHIKTLVNKREHTGKKSIIWDCTDNMNNPVPSGIYFCHLTFQDASLLKRIVVIR